MAPGPLISLHDVRFHRGEGHESFRLELADLSIEPGECVACIGPSGSGKTTLLHLICGVLMPTSGEIRVLGHTLHSMPEPTRRELRLNRIGMVFQEFELLEYLTAADNITIGARLAGGRDAKVLRERALSLADAAGVRHVLDRKPHRMSQGERQRVAICRALVNEPPLILGDEPTGNLDPGATGRVVEILLQQARRTGATLLVATHNHAVLSRFDRVLDMEQCVRRGAP
jgi:putative ABC transport system ATP-binding protein